MRRRSGDLFLAVAAACVQLVGTYVASRHEVEVRRLDGVSTLLLMAGPAALMLRRSRPGVALGATLVVTLAYYWQGYPRGPAFVALAVALITAAALGRRNAALVAVAVAGLGVVTGGVLTERVAPGPALSGVAWAAVAVLLTDQLRSRKLAAAEAARARAQEELRRAGEERLRIARELHDVLAHSISLINVRAGIALHLLDEQPEQARDALVTIKQASADGLRDLRRTLGILREEAARTPTPGLADLDRLLEGARGAGLDVASEIRGSPREVEVPVGLAAYRVVQESLTNVSRHAGRGRARVLLDYGEDAVDVRIDDDGPASSSVGTGHGLAGMAERATALGGTFEAGERPDGGFSVHVRLPVQPALPALPALPA